MSIFESIEYFFAKEETHHIPFTLQTSQIPKKKIMQQHEILAPRKKQPAFIPKKTVPLPEKKNIPAPDKATLAPKKDHFYSEWEKKYKELHAENLLTKNPFKRHALFIIDKNAPKAFAEKICSAINSRLIKTTFIIADKPLEKLIEEHQPTHLIMMSSIAETLPLPGILIDNLSHIENSPEKKKALWLEIKEKLKT